MLTVDSLAKEKFLEIIKNKGTEDQGVKVKINGRNAKDFKYDFTFVTKGTDTSEYVIVDSGELKVFVDSSSSENLKGAKIIYGTDDFGGFFKVENPNKPAWSNPIAEEIMTVVEEDVNPSLAMHGGFMELIDVKGNDVLVKFGGGCQGCSAVDVTVKQGVEKMIKGVFPEIENIIDVTSHSDGENPYYK